MSNEALLIYKKAGLSEESTWGQGTVTDATKLLPLRDSGIALGLASQVIQPVRLRGRASLSETILGTTAPSMTIPAFGYPVGVGLKLLKAALGTVTSTEVASFTVELGVNDKIDFTEDGGAEVTATLTAGTYAAGATSAVAGSLCALIKAQMEAVNGASTYTVAFSTTTKKFTITKSTGVFVLLWASGTNKLIAADTLLGFAADTASAIAATSATAVEIVYSHVVSIVEAITYGLSAGLTAQVKLADEKVFDILDCVVNVLNINYAPNQELHFDAEMQARKVTASSADLAALTSPSTTPLLYSQAAFTLNSVSVDLSALQIAFNNAYKTDLFVNSRYRSKFVRGGPRQVTGNFSYDITDSRIYALFTSFEADSAGVPLVATFTSGTLIKGTTYYSMSFNLPLIKYNFDSVPGGGGLDAPAGQANFIALDDDTNGELKITVVNNEASI